MNSVCALGWFDGAMVIPFTISELSHGYGSPGVDNALSSMRRCRVWSRGDLRRVREVTQLMAHWSCVERVSVWRVIEVV